MLDILGESNSVALVGLLGGLALGLAARIGRFCTLGAIEDFHYSSDNRRLRMWGLAIGVAIIGTQIAFHFDHLDLLQTAYLDRVWNPFATAIGGLIFGYGMALSGNCGYGALARLGGGDIRSFLIVIVMGLSAYFVMSGPLAHTRVWLFPVETDAITGQGFGQLFENLIGVSPVISGWIIGGGLILIAISNRHMLSSWKFIFWGVIVGLSIVSGWVGTNWVAVNGFNAEPIETHSFAAPIGDTIFYSMTASGNSLSFSVGSVVGVVLGAFIGTVIQDQFRWEACEDPREVGRQVFGAMLMGVGAILAVGCSIGQGISAFSTLAFSAPLAFVMIFIGATVGLRNMLEGV